MPTLELTHEEAVRFLLADGVGPATVQRLLEYFGSAGEVFGASTHRLEQVQGIGHAKAEKMARSWSGDALVHAELALAERLGARIVTFSDPNYPDPLREIDGAPFMLYVLGEITPTDKLAVAVVGSRQASFYGLKVAGRLSRQMAGLGLTVVSGLARGIDSAAHEGALEGGGRTIAVIGTGLARIYPEENIALAQRVAQRGAVVSEFPLETGPQPGNFPRRNRLISGLSLGVVVVEAPKRSGALITARLAGEQGREVFAVPGKIDMPGFAGCHALIKDGAKLVEDAHDIVAELGPLSREVSLDGQTVSVPRSLTLSDREKAIYDCLDSDPRSIDEVIERTGLPAAAVSSVLLMLEVRKLVTQLPGKRFVRTRVFE